MFDHTLFFLSQSPPLYISLMCAIGAVMGSFLNMLIYRLPLWLKHQWKQECTEFLEITSTVPIDPLPFAGFLTRSQCPHCHHRIPLYQNIPLVSFILLKCHCAFCAQPIPNRYFLVELITTILSGLMAWHFGLTEETLFALILVFGLITLSFIDLEHGILPDQITQPLIWFGLLVNAFSWSFQEIEDAILGAVLGYLVLWIVYWGFKLVTQKEGMGFGDFKLLALLGAWLGWQMLPQIVIISSVLGAGIGIIQILFKKRHRNTPIPFGPYLAFAGIIALVWGEQINMAYLNWILLGV